MTLLPLVEAGDGRSRHRPVWPPESLKALVEIETLRVMRCNMRFLI